MSSCDLRLGIEAIADAQALVEFRDPADASVSAKTVPLYQLWPTSHSQREGYLI